MVKPTNAVKDSWNAKAYDDFRVRILKGRKATVEALPDWLNPRYDAHDVLQAAQSNMNFIPV